VQLEAAAWLEVHGRVDLAQGPLARAAELAPDRPDVRRAMGVTSCRQGRPDEARQALQFMFDDPAQRDPAALVLLGEAYQADQRHREALECFGAAQQASHGLSRDKSFRKTVRASEKQVPDAAVLPRRGLLSGWRGKLVLAGLLLSAALLVGEWFASRSVPLYVVNGLPAPVTVEVAGEKLTVSAGDWRKLAVGEGEHEATFSCPSAGLRGAHAFELHASLWSRLFNRRTHVLNPFAAAVLARERTVYAEDPDRYADEYKAELLLTGPYAALEGFHYRFEAYPEQIQMEGARETRTRLSLCEVPPFQAISAALAEENADMALALDALEAHCRADPGKVELLQLYHLLGAQQNQLERVMATLEAGLAVRPVRIGWHRFYQTVAIQQGRRQEVLDRYERLLAEAPDDPDRLYLAGRLGHGRRASMPYVQRALAREPAHAWALISRCYHELGAGEVAAAATTADALRPHAATNALAEHWWIHANWAAGEQRALRAHLRQKLREAPDDYGAMLGLLALRAPDADIGRFTT